MTTSRTALTCLLLATALVSGCLTVGGVQHATASGRPEVTISGKASAKTVLADITNEMVNLAYMPRTRSETLAVFERDLDRAEAFLIRGLPTENNPVRRITYDIVESSSSTRVLATLSIVRDPAGKNEKATPVNESKESIQWQQLLDRVKSKYEKR